MKIISWNVNGIRAVLKKGFHEFATTEKPDIICIQETKAHPSQVDNLLVNYPHHVWNSAEKPGYAGTAIFSMMKPISVRYGKDTESHQGEGRIITLEFPKYYLTTVYTPNSGRELVRLDYRRQWDQRFLTYLKQLEQKKPVIVCGDLNVAHTPMDLANPKTNYNVTAGYTQIEIDGFENLMKAGFVDIFREFHKEPGHYTFWTYMMNARAKNIGWRIDYFLVSSALRLKVKDSFILPRVLGSDHCPIGMELNP